MEMNLPEAGELALEDIPPALARLAALQGQLAARLMMMGKEAPAAAVKPEEGDEMLTTKEAARELGVDVDWLYRHAKTLPFARRLSRKCLRFSRKGLVFWRDRRKV